MAPRVTKRKPTTFTENIGDNVAVAEPVKPGTDDCELAEPIALDPYDRAQKLDSFTIFEVGKKLTSADWSAGWRYYVYRLEPPVRNAGPHSNIGMYEHPIEAADIQREHGGGLYHIWLRDPDAYIKKVKVGIAGPPKFLPGQTIKNEDGSTAPAVAAPAVTTQPSNNSAVQEIAGVLRELIARENPGANITQAALANALETMKTGMNFAVEAAGAAAKREGSSTTGNPLADRLLELMITKMASGGDAPKRSSIEEKLLEAAVQRLMNPVEERPSALSMLGELKETLGLDLPSLLKGGGGGKRDWRDDLVGLAGGALTKIADSIPKIVDYLEKRDNWKFQVTQMNAGRRMLPVTTGLAPQPSAPVAPAPAVSPTPPAPPQFSVTPGAPQPATVVASPEAPPPSNVTVMPSAPELPADLMQMIDELCKSVLKLYIAGTPGDGAADFIRSGIPPQLFALLRSRMESLEDVKQFAMSHAFYKQISVDPDFNRQDFDEFITAFWQEITSGPDGTAAA